MTRKIYIKLLGLFTLLLVFVTLVMETVFFRLVEQAEPGTLHVIAPYAFWSGIVALAIAIPLAAWIESSRAPRWPYGPCFE